jgi:glycosyltransferase involved in cell wall biosynthesis
MDLTACIITYNEEQNIRDCLDSLSFCPARVVVDSHSTDATREIAEECGAQVVVRDWPGHIPQMSYAVEQAGTEWVLWLDADERVTPELRREILAALAGPDPADGYSFNRRNIYLGRWVKHGGWYPDRKVRLFRRSRARIGGVPPHNVVRMAPGARTAWLKGDLEHHTFDTIAQHVDSINYYSGITAGEMVRRGRRLLGLRQWLDPAGRFLRMIVLQAGWLDGWRGFVLAGLGAFDEFLRYAKARELVRNRQGRDLRGAGVTYSRPGDTASSTIESRHQSVDPAMGVRGEPGMRGKTRTVAQATSGVDSPDHSDPVA